MTRSKVARHLFSVWQGHKLILAAVAFLHSACHLRGCCSASRQVDLEIWSCWSQIQLNSSSESCSVKADKMMQSTSSSIVLDLGCTWLEWIGQKCNRLQWTIEKLWQRDFFERHRSWLSTFKSYEDRLLPAVPSNMWSSSWKPILGRQEKSKVCSPVWRCPQRPLKTLDPWIWCGQETSQGNCESCDPKHGRESR